MNNANNNQEVSLNLDCLTSIDEEIAWELVNFHWMTLSLNWLTSLDEETAWELVKFGWYNLWLDWLTSLDKETAWQLAKFKWDDLWLDWLTSLDKETAWELAKFKWDLLWLSWLTNIPDEVAKILMPIKSKIRGYELNKKINEVEKKIMDEWLQTLQDGIQNTNKNENWSKNRWNVSYDVDKWIVSWWKTVSVEYVTKDSIQLEWLDMQLNHEQWLWLANFKNWLKNIYWDKKVEFKRDVINRRFDMKKTFVVGGKMLISRWDLESHLPMCKDDSVMENILTWLNA